MAKLSAHGEELLRFSKEKEVSDDPIADWRKTTYILMSDGVIMWKHQVRFKDGQKHDYGWKHYRKVKDVSGFATRFEALMVADGYKKEC